MDAQKKTAKVAMVASQAPPKLPLIHLSTKHLEIGTSCWVSACNDVRRALEDHGCFEATIDEVSVTELHSAIFHAVEELFDLSTETKLRYTPDDSPLYGFAGPTGGSPLRESMNVKHPTVLEEIQSFTNLMWPCGNEQFCETVYSYSKLVSRLDQMVKRMVLESYGMEKYYDSDIKESSSYLLRVIKYREPETNESNLGITSHADQTLMTILHQNQVNGLEIQTKDGDWIQVLPSVSSFVVLAGQAFSAWSNGRIHSPIHRVIMSRNKTRYSVGLFSYSTGIIRAPEELVDEDHPLMFKPYNHLDSMFSFLKDNVPKSK